MASPHRGLAARKLFSRFRLPLNLSNKKDRRVTNEISATANETMKSCTFEKKSSTRKSSLLDVPVTMFANARATSPLMDVSIANLLRDIRAGRYAASVTSLRNLRAVDAKAYDQKKTELPAFTMSGTAATRKEPLIHSGFIQVDLDDLGESLPTVRDKVMRDPHIAFGFVSPSGDGLKLGLRIDCDRHAESFAAAQVYFRDTFEVAIDKRVKDRLRLCFVSHDPDLWTNPDAAVLPVESVMQVCSKDSSASCTLQTAHLHHYSLHNTASLHNVTKATTSCDTVIENIRQARAALSLLEKENALLAKFYKDVIEPRFQAQPHARNNFLVEAVPFLYRAVSASVVLRLVGCFYDCNRALFNDPREQHLKEAEAVIAGVGETYIRELNADERAVYGELDRRETDGFRICRDLALLPDPEGKREPPACF